MTAEVTPRQIANCGRACAPPPFSWTGFYLGGNVGAGFGTTETSVNVGPALTAVTGTPVAATAPLVSETFNGFVGGIQAGYNWQAGVFVLGVEGDLDAAGLQGNAPCVVVLNCTMKHNWFADITGRVGVVAVDRSLIYLKGGVAWEGSNFSVGNSITGGGMSLAANASGSGTQTGGLLGMGVEYAFLPNWSAKIEYKLHRLRQSLVQRPDINKPVARWDAARRSYRNTLFDHRK